MGYTFIHSKFMGFKQYESNNVKHKSLGGIGNYFTSNAHITKYSTRTATITVKLKIKHKKYHEYAKALYIFSTYLLPQ